MSPRRRTRLIAAVIVLGTVADPGATSASGATPVDAGAEALAAVNTIRSQAGLGAVTDDSSSQQGVREHACWTVLNGLLMHGALPGTPGYTLAAEQAGERSNLAASSSAAATAASFVDLWATGPYHALGLLRPQLQSVSYGHCTGDVSRWNAAGTLDVISGLGPAPASRQLVTFPASGATTHLTRFVAESPNPLDNCGWSSGGLPIIAMLPTPPAPGTTAALTGPGGPVEVCVITAHTDVHPTGRALLEGEHAVVVIPETALTGGAWSVSIDAGEHVVSWSFNVDHPISSGAVTQSTRPPADPAKFVPVGPCRLVDTRTDETGELAIDQVITVQVSSRCGIPAGATSVAISVTAAGAAQDGYVSVWPHGRARPDTSMINVDRGDTRANSGLVRLGTAGAIDVLTNAGGHIVIDATGAFVPADASSDGRFEPISPQRLLDTRTDRALDADATVTIPLPDGIPHDAGALAVNLTTAASPGPGYFTAYAAGSVRPNASVLNTSGPDQVRAASTIVPVSANGLSVYSSGGGHLIVDVTGWFTSASSDVSTSGLFVAEDPLRILDTRDGTRPGSGDVRAVDIGADAGAVVVNTTTVDPDTAGFLTVYPAGTERPETSAVNGQPGRAAANLTIAPVHDHALAVYAHTGGDVLVDRSGWFQR